MLEFIKRQVILLHVYIQASEHKTTQAKKDELEKRLGKVICMRQVTINVYTIN